MQPLRSRRSVHGGVLGLSLAVSAAWTLANCGQVSVRERLVQQDERLCYQEEGLSQEQTQTSALDTSTAVGLALEIEEGVEIPLRVRAGQTYFINQIDARAAAPATVDERLPGLARAADWPPGAWAGLRLADEDVVSMPNPNGTFTRRRYYRDAAWMHAPSKVQVQPVGASGQPTGEAIELDLGGDDGPRGSDDFFVRRLRAIEWTRDCRAPGDCVGARDYEAEALVEVRNARHPDRTFQLSASTTALLVTWSPLGGVARIPVEQIAQPAYAYGVKAELKALTPPDASGVYAPGSDLTFQLTLRDGKGQRLHPEGSLPTYNEAVFGPNPAGIQYYRAFIDPTAVYYRRKHRERMLAAQIVGPMQDVQAIRHVTELPAFLDPTTEVQTIGLPARDGFFAQAKIFPSANNLFGGAFDPAHAAWSAPISDRWTYHLPADARPGTYAITVKGRRTFLGEDIPFSHTVEIQVGTTQHTKVSLGVGRCSTCHQQGGELSKVAHANDKLGTCTGCHAPLGFELEGPVAVRTHFIHSRSERVGVPVERCSSCHLSASSAQRTSKAACLSCHQSYPADHETSYGPIENMYVGGGRESFAPCTGACHTTHPNSGF